MIGPTDGNDHTDHTDHPDLANAAGEMRAEWRAEQEAATADAAAQWRYSRGLADWLHDRMHAGDRVAVTVTARQFVGLVDEVGPDLLALRMTSGLVEIHLADAIPISLEVVEHATTGGTRARSRRGLRDALLARDGQTGVTVGSVPQPDGIEGALLVGADFVSVVATSGIETIIPIAHVAWVTASR